MAPRSKTVINSYQLYLVYVAANASKLDHISLWHFGIFDKTSPQAKRHKPLLWLLSIEKQIQHVHIPFHLRWHDYYLVFYMRKTCISRPAVLVFTLLKEQLMSLFVPKQRFVKWFVFSFFLLTIVYIIILMPKSSPYNL